MMWPYGVNTFRSHRGLAGPAASRGATGKRFKGQSGMDQSDEDWWRYGIFYQIYPRSFQDFNGDGVGDINGVIARLAYLEVPWYKCGLAVADLSFADGGFRLRHFRLHRHRSAIRHHGGFRRVDGRRA